MSRHPGLKFADKALRPRKPRRRYVNWRALWDDEDGEDVVVDAFRYAVICAAVLLLWVCVVGLGR